MEKLHTPEPWGVDFNNTYKGKPHYMVGVPGERICVALTGTVGAGDDEESKANARRIVACVNACRDIDMTVLEMPNYSVKAELDTLDAQIAGRLKAESQRDELLAALRALYGWQRAEVEHFGATTPDDFIIEMVEKALKSVEGNYEP